MAHTKQSFIFKTVDNLDLQVDVYLPNTPPPSDAGYPVIFHTHGGGMVIGDRNTFYQPFFERLIKRNWAFVSFDYRLAPEVKINELWSDVDDAYKWLLNDAARLAKTVLDTSRIAVFGCASGGYLAVLAGYKFTPRPKVIIDFYGICGIQDPYYRTPKKISDPAKVIPDSVKSAILDHPISGFDITNKTDARASLVFYFFQNGIYVQQTMGLDIYNPSDSEKLNSLTPIRNITADYPPTFIVHGNKDDIGPLEDSIQLAQELEKHGVPHQFIVADGHDHSFDKKLKPEDEAWSNYVEPAFAFA